MYESTNMGNLKEHLYIHLIPQGIGHIQQLETVDQNHGEWRGTSKLHLLHHHAKIYNHLWGNNCFTPVSSRYETHKSTGTSSFLQRLIHIWLQNTSKLGASFSMFTGTISAFVRWWTLKVLKVEQEVKNLLHTVCSQLEKAYFCPLLRSWL